MTIMERTFTVQGNHRILIEDSSLAIEYLPRDDLGQSLAHGTKWTAQPIPFGSDVRPGSFRVLATTGHKWSVDLLVAFRENQLLSREVVELWRVSPWRIRRRERVLFEGRPFDHPVTFATRLDSGEGFDIVLRRPELTTIYRVSVKELNGALRKVRKRREVETEWDLFISYKANDHPDRLPQVIAQELATDYYVWLDQDQLITDYQDEIAQAIKNSFGYLVFYTPNTEDSGVDSDTEDLDEDSNTVNRRMSQAEELNLIKNAVKGHPDRKIFTYLIGQEKASPDYTKDQWHVIRASSVDPEQMLEKVRSYLYSRRKQRAS